MIYNSRLCQIKSLKYHEKKLSRIKTQIKCSSLSLCTRINGTVPMIFIEKLYIFMYIQKKKCLKIDIYTLNDRSVDNVSVILKHFHSMILQFMFNIVLLIINK